MTNVLDSLPKSTQLTARKMPNRVKNEDREPALESAKRFDGKFGSRWPKGRRKAKQRPL